MKLAVITAIYGNFDEVPPVPLGFDEAILISDVPIKSGWENIVNPLPLPHRLAAKLPKCRPDLFTSCDSSVWLDASGRDNNNRLRIASREILKSTDLAAFRHPTRSCIYDEAARCKHWPKYREWPIEKQVRRYQEAGYPVNNGLWACGVIMRNHTNRIKSFGDRWLLENAFHSVQDQLSFPYLLWDMNIECSEIPGKIWGDFIEWSEHQTNEMDSIAKRIENRIKRLVSNWKSST